MLKKIKSLQISGLDSLPIIEGGKGVGITNGILRVILQKLEQLALFQELTQITLTKIKNIFL